MKPGKDKQGRAVVFAQQPVQELGKSDYADNGPECEGDEDDKIHYFPFPETISAIFPIRYSYFPRMSRMKLPEMPGRIIAQIAMAPLMKMNHSPSGVTSLPSLFP